MVIFQNNSTGNDSNLWSFGDDMSSDAISPTYTYAEAGTYFVSLEVENDCGSDIISQAIVVGELPQAAFTLDNNGGCEPHLVQFVNTSTGNYDQVLWDFPGGNPSSSTEENPSVIYNTPGVYDVSLTVQNPSGNNTVTVTELITVLNFPTADFNFILDGTTVTFENLSADATNFTWNFGDGATSNETNPTHTYSENGLYTVTLNAGNAFCGTSISYDVFIDVSATEEEQLPEWLAIYPNPAKDYILVDIQKTLNKPLELRVYNTTGQLVKEKQIQGTTPLDLALLAPGVYYLHLQQAENRWQQFIVKL